MDEQTELTTEQTTELTTTDEKSDQPATVITRKPVTYTWQSVTGTEAVITKYIADTLVAFINTKGGSAIGDNMTDRTIKVTVELNPPTPIPDQPIE